MHKRWEFSVVAKVVVKFQFYSRQGVAEVSG